MTLVSFCLLQNQMRSIIPGLVIALKHLIKANQVNIKDFFFFLQDLMRLFPIKCIQEYD